MTASDLANVSFTGGRDVGGGLVVPRGRAGASTSSMMSHRALGTWEASCPVGLTALAHRYASSQSSLRPSPAGDDVSG